MNVIIMSGVSGSGKNTYIARRFANAHGHKDPINAVVCSADDFFEKTGSYVFDPSKLGEAHGACMRKFIRMACPWDDGLSNIDDCENLVVNNTNTTIEELAPYVAVAAAYRHPIEIVTIHCEPEVAAARSLHCNSLLAVQGMCGRISARKIPPFWNVKLTDVSSERMFSPL